MDGVVAFDYPAWALYFPELASSVSQQQAQMYFNRAQMFCDNTPCSLIKDWGVGGSRYMLLLLATAHVAALNASINDQPSSPLVGRINSATEGSISVQTQLDVPPGCPQYYAQTKYGIEWWVSTAQYRTMRYVPGRTRNMDPFQPGPFPRW